MTKFFVLVRLNLLNALLSTFGNSNSGKTTKRKSSGWVVLLSLSALMLYVSGLYSSLLAQTLAPHGQLDALFSLMIFFGIFFCTTLTIYLAQSLLFSASDNGQLFSFPVSAFTILLARLSALYLEVLFILELFFLPVGIVFLINSDEKSPLPLFTLLILGIFLSFIPTLLSLVFGLFYSFILAKTPFKNVFSILIGFLMPLCIMVLNITFSSASTTSILSLHEQLTHAFPPLSWAMLACTQGDILSFFLIVLLCTLPFFAASFGISCFYKQLLTGLLSRRSHTKFKLTHMQTKSPFWALFSKEAKRFFGTPGYFLNAGFGYILLILAAVASLLFQNDVKAILAPYMQMFYDLGLHPTSIRSILVLSIVCFANLTFQPSAVCLSLENKTSWLLKSLPLSAQRIFIAKISFPFVCSFVCILFSTPIFGFVLSLPVLNIVEISLLTLANAALTATIGLICNLLHPKLDSSSEIVVIKQSMSSFLGLLMNLIQVMILITLYSIFTVLPLGPLRFFLPFLLLISACYLAFLWLKTRGSNLFFINF